MALQAEEADVVGPGIQANAPTKGAFALNMLYKTTAGRSARALGRCPSLTQHCPSPRAEARSTGAMANSLAPA